MRLQSYFHGNLFIWSVYPGGKQIIIVPLPVIETAIKKYHGEKQAFFYVEK